MGLHRHLSLWRDRPGIEGAEFRRRLHWPAMIVVKEGGLYPGTNRVVDVTFEPASYYAPGAARWQHAIDADTTGTIIEGRFRERLARAREALHQHTLISSIRTTSRSRGTWAWASPRASAHVAAWS
jgi:hypothetical protein